MRRAARYADAWHPIRLTPQQVRDTAAELRAVPDGGTPPDVVPMSHYVRLGKRREDRGGREDLLTGTPDHIAADLREYRDAGVRLMMMRFGVDGPEELLAAMETFATSVAPQLA
jgi:alkanesulfonate monooxygenase SsuD/methylene tetrahydromethanopterin reductase-like flavin-dependent oxidoreductase (luciferase family)